MVVMSRKESVFDGMSTKEDIIDGVTVENEENIEEEVSEATMMYIDDFRNGCMR